MTLDEAIKHCEEKAKELRIEAEQVRDIGEVISNPKQPYNEPVKNCLACAEEHEQLAESEMFEKEKVNELSYYERVIANGKPYEERQQGKWIIVKDERWGDNVKCPFCGKELAGTDLNFCCKCGADMRGVRKNDK